MINIKELDYLLVLRALKEIPFSVGRKLLIDFLKGSEANKSILKNRLHLLDSFGTMIYDDDELNQIIDSLIINSMISVTSIDGKKFWKVLELSAKGKKEIDCPTLYKKKLSFNFREAKTEITDEDKRLFNVFRDFLHSFNEEQKKSIICDNKHILCLAGAGSGKTTVLTKRIEFLVNYKRTDPKNILAITFTRKARMEMMRRISKMGRIDSVKVETFNSFCEKILRKHNDIVYGKPVRVVTYRDKIMMIHRALTSLSMTMSQAVNIYFSSAQKRGKSDDQLANIFLNDCFFIRDYFKFKNKKIDASSFETSGNSDEKSAKMVFAVCNYLEAYMKKRGLRDFADQLVDTITLFEKHKELIPEFEHVLIDEYQDVNSTQIRLIDILNPPNLFCVGDPRQSIYGWRGSDIRYILNFEDKYPACEVITLTKNYRSAKHIVDVINSSIRNMGLADLESSIDGDKDIKLLKFGSEAAEFEFVVQKIIASDVSKGEIFVLARTNRQLNELSEILRARRIKHVVRSDEMRKSISSGVDDVTLATIHAIKGLEAELVFVIGCSYANFPCKGSEHPVVDMVKVEEYDKEEEERRIFYVAMSRAKRSLYLSYSGSRPTYFINSDMLGMMDAKELKVQVKKMVNTGFSGDVVGRLKSWRREVSNAMGVPAFMIMHDRTIAEVADAMPKSTDDLSRIHGFGPTKISKYGDDILEVVNG